MGTVLNDADEVRRRMALIRHDLHQDVRDVVETAEAVADWQRYIRKFPWVSVGLAVAVGYVVVPRRRRRAPADVAKVTDVAEVREAGRQQGREQELTKVGLLAAAWGMLSPVALRLAQGYAVQFAENWLLQQQQRAAGPPPSSQPSEPGWSGGTRAH